VIRSWDGFLYHQSAPGDVIRAEEWNQLKGWLRRVRPRPGPGISLQETPDGTIVACPTAPNWYFAYTPLAGIGARVGTPPSDLVPGSATCQVYEWNGEALTLFDPDRVVLNAWRAGVAGSRLIRIEPRWGKWWAVNEDCPVT
jgi:hypothetical protein